MEKSTMTPEEVSIKLLNASDLGDLKISRHIEICRNNGASEEVVEEGLALYMEKTFKKIIGDILENLEDTKPETEERQTLLIAIIDTVEPVLEIFGEDRFLKLCQTEIIDIESVFQ